MILGPRDRTKPKFSTSTKYIMTMEIRLEIYATALYNFFYVALAQNLLVNLVG